MDISDFMVELNQFGWVSMAWNLVWSACSFAMAMYHKLIEILSTAPTVR
jgi:hypothetical protein